AAQVPGRGYQPNIPASIGDPAHTSDPFTPNSTGDPKIITARWRAPAPLLSVGDLIMARRQLVNLAPLAESGRSGTAI
ncbi:MAG: hypothetical protein ACR2NR_19925, partial [Solirubrobacteraceae bacterium]